MLPKQPEMVDAVRKHYAGRSDRYIANILSKSSLQAILDLPGVTPAMLAAYSLAAGRADEAYQLRDSLPDVDLTRIEADYFLGQLAQEYVVSTLNDRENLRQLALLMAKRARITRELDETNPAQTRAVQQVNATILDLERHMMIDPQARADAEGQAEGFEVMRDWIDQSRDFLAEHGVIHSAGGEIGLTLWFYPRSDQRPYCHACGSYQLVVDSPYDGKTYPFAVFTDEQAAAYLIGGAIPVEGAPEDLPMFTPADAASGAGR